MPFRQKPTQKTTISGFCIVKILLKTNGENYVSPLRQFEKCGTKNIKTAVANCSEI